MIFYNIALVSSALPTIERHYSQSFVITSGNPVRFYLLSCSFTTFLSKTHDPVRQEILRRGHRKWLLVRNDSYRFDTESDLIAQGEFERCLVELARLTFQRVGFRQLASAAWIAGVDSSTAMPHDQHLSSCQMC